MAKNDFFFFSPPVPSLSEVQLGETPLHVILEAVTNGTCNNEADAKVSYDIAYNLMLKLANFLSAKAGKKDEVSFKILNFFTYRLVYFHFNF